MLSFLKARFQVRAINTFLDAFEPRDNRPVDQRVYDVVTRLESRRLAAEQALDSMRRRYEPTRKRVPSADGRGTIVQPVGMPDRYKSK